MDYKSILKKALPHLLALIVMTGAAVAYFYPQLEGKVIAMDDAISGAQADGEAAEYRAKTGKERYFWSNGQFGGMPKMMWVPMQYNKVLKVYNAFKLGFGDPIGMFLAMMIFAYALYFFLARSWIIAAGLAIATSLCTSNVILYEAGHYSKIGTLAFTPLIILGALLLFQRKSYMWGGLTLCVGLASSLTTQHPQMTYYIFMMFVFFGGVYAYYSYREGELTSFGKSLGVAALAAAVALGMTSTRVISAYDYSKSSLRGKAILSGGGDSSSSAAGGSGGDGLGWQYAAQWSNNTGDLAATYFVPGVVGGGSGEKVPTSYESYRKYRMKRAPLYWGGLPFTVGPIYFGVGLTFLFLLGLLSVPGRAKWWLGIGVGLMTLFSMGRYFNGVNLFLFEHLPLYDKFRAPQTILNALFFFLPVLGAMLLGRISSLPKSKNDSSYQKISKNTLISLAVLGGPLLLLYLFGPSFFSFESAGDQRYVAQGADVSAFIADRKSLFRSDILRSLGIILVIGGGILAHTKKHWINATVMLAIVALVVVGDLWGVSKRYLDHDDFVRPKKVQEVVNQERTIDQQIKAMEPDRARYRIQDMTIDTYNSSQASYQHNTIGGYDPAKLRRYQDILDHQINRGNMQVYNMLNTKYFIVNQNGTPAIQRNAGALGNAWYVQDINTVSTPDEEIASLSTIDPRQTASVLRNEFSSDYHTFNPTYDPTASIVLSDYEPDRLVYKTNASSDQLAVFSEVWYNGNRDWVSYIDGQKVDHIRANYILRAMKVPAGQHEIVFEFKPVVYATGERISMISSILFWLVLIGALIYEGRRVLLEPNAKSE